jgi:hypothetical protein
MNDNWIKRIEEGLAGSAPGVVNAAKAGVELANRAHAHRTDCPVQHGTIEVSNDDPESFATGTSLLTVKFRIPTDVAADKFRMNQIVGAICRGVESV